VRALELEPTFCQQIISFRASPPIISVCGEWFQIATHAISCPASKEIANASKGKMRRLKNKNHNPALLP